MTDAPKEIPERVTVELDRPRTVGYNNRIEQDWTREMAKVEIAELKELQDLGVPVDLSTFKKRQIEGFKPGAMKDLTVMMYVMLRQTDASLTLDKVAEMITGPKVKPCIQAVCDVMGMKVSFEAAPQTGAGAAGPAEKAEAKN